MQTCRFKAKPLPLNGRGYHQEREKNMGTVVQMFTRGNAVYPQRLSSDFELELKMTLEKMMNEYPESKLDFLGTVADWLDQQAGCS